MTAWSLGQAARTGTSPALVTRTHPCSERSLRCTVLCAKESSEASVTRAQPSSVTFCSDVQDLPRHVGGFRYVSSRSIRLRVRYTIRSNVLHRQVYSIWLSRTLSIRTPREPLPHTPVSPRGPNTKRPNSKTPITVSWTLQEELGREGGREVGHARAAREVQRDRESPRVTHRLDVLVLGRRARVRRVPACVVSDRPTFASIRVSFSRLVSPVRFHSSESRMMIESALK